jgi:cytochrome c-type biogenesis protein
MLEIGLFSAFIAGILTFVSPCILPLVPVYIGIMSNKIVQKDDKIRLSQRLYIFIHSLLFVLGFTIVFVALGSTATFIGQFLENPAVRRIINIIGGSILIIFGLNYMGLFRIRFLNMEKRFNMPASIKNGYIGSFVFGLVFSIGWVPCVGMILSGILLLASSLDTLLDGIVLLLVYSLGIGIPFILASIFLSFFSRLLSRMNKHLNIVSIITGVLVIALGIILVIPDRWFSIQDIISFLSSRIPFLGNLNI